MIRQHARFRGSLGGAAILVSVAALGGCGSDPQSTGSGAGQSGPAVAENHPPPPPPAPRPQTKEQCDACRGLWAVHGIGQAETCICATSDSGKECTDGSECQGQCIVNPETGFQVMDAPTQRGYYTGSCSQYDTTFGCYYIIPPGIGETLPLPADEAIQHLCID